MTTWELAPNEKRAGSHHSVFVEVLLGHLFVMGVARKHVLEAFSFHVVHESDLLVSACCRVAVVVSNAHNQDTEDV